MCDFENIVPIYKGIVLNNIVPTKVSSCFRRSMRVHMLVKCPPQT